MGKKELIVKFFVWWIVVTALIFAAIMSFFQVTMPGGLFVAVGVLVAWIMWISDVWRNWLRE